MQVTAAQPSLSQFLAPQQRETAFGGDSAVAAKPAAPATPVPQEAETVSLQTAAGTPSPAAPESAAPAPHIEVFAEIWKDGMKIGSVYTDGTAILPTMEAGAAAGIHSSARLPFVQAQEISRMVGGEVRVVDIGALQTARARTQLRTAYGA